MHKKTAHSDGFLLMEFGSDSGNVHDALERA